jgi:hypothetical protein
MRTKASSPREALDDFKRLSPQRQAIVVGLLAGALAMVTAAELDLHRRPRDQVRGSKFLWRLACLNALGAASYFRWGRRPS